MSGATAFETDLKNVTSGEIPLTAIHENPAALRGVNKEDPEYVLLLESIKRLGVQLPVLVRKQVNAETGETFYGLIDGLHRFSASQDAGRLTIPVRVVETADDLKALELQIVLNARRVATKPVEYTKAIQRLISANPTMTIEELAVQKLSASPEWVRERLGLLNLCPEIQVLVDDGKIVLSNAYALAKLKDHDEQKNFLERAVTQAPTEFVPTVQARVKQIAEDRRKGRGPRPEGFVATPRLQRIPDLKAELDNPTAGPYLHRECAPEAGADWDLGFQMALNWVLQLDPKSLVVAEDNWKKAKAKQELDKQARQAEKKQKELDAAKELLAKSGQTIG